VSALHEPGYGSDLRTASNWYFGRIDHSPSYGFWYPDQLEMVESASANTSANLYNEKSSKPHLKQ